MQTRLLHLLDASVFGTVFGFAMVAGYSASEIGAILAGIGALCVGVGRMLEHIGKFLDSKASAKVKKTYVDPEVYHLLENLKCWNAPNCPTREIFEPDDKGEK